MFLFWLQLLKVEKVWVKQMGKARVHRRAKHDLPASGTVFLPFIKDRLDLLALQPVLTFAEITGDDGTVHGFGKRLAVHLSQMSEGTALIFPR